MVPYYDLDSSREHLLIGVPLFDLDSFRGHLLIGSNFFSLLKLLIWDNGLKLVSKAGRLVFVDDKMMCSKLLSPRRMRQGEDDRKKAKSCFKATR